jgi:hypothetical protein
MYTSLLLDWLRLVSESPNPNVGLAIVANVPDANAVTAVSARPACPDAVWKLASAPPTSLMLAPGAAICSTVALHDTVRLSVVRSTPMLTLVVFAA